MSSERRELEGRAEALRMSTIWCGQDGSRGYSRRQTALSCLSCIPFLRVDTWKRFWGSRKLWVNPLNAGVKVQLEEGWDPLPRANNQLLVYKPGRAISKADILEFLPS